MYVHSVFQTIETLQFSGLKERNVNLIPIWAVI